MTKDPIEQTETAADQDREARAANLLDIRRIIGGLFLLYGLILTILGLVATDEDIARAAGSNVNLFAGISMLVVGGIFIAWAILRPIGQELAESKDE